LVLLFFVNQFFMYEVGYASKFLNVDFKTF
jgi:hypothetical protein